MWMGLFDCATHLYQCISPAEDEGGLASTEILDDARQVVVQAALKQEIGFGGGVAAHDGVQRDRADFLPKVQAALGRRSQPRGNIAGIGNGCRCSDEAH